MTGRARRISQHAAPDHRHPGRHGAGIGRTTTPSRTDLPVALRSAQPVPGQCRRRPPIMGDGVPAPQLFWTRWPRGGRSHARTPVRGSGSPPHPGGVQRKDARLAVVLHVHVPYRARRQVPARGIGGIRLRSPVANLQVQADGGGPSFVRGRSRHRPHPATHLRGDEGNRVQRPRQSPQCRRNRSADDPEIPELSFQRDAGPVRFPDFDQCGQICTPKV